MHPIETAEFGPTPEGRGDTYHFYCLVGVCVCRKPGMGVSAKL